MELFVPGRICLFGEHSAWAGGYRRQNSELEKGYTIITGTNQGIYVRVKLHSDSLVLKSVLPDGSRAEKSVPMESAVLLEEAQRGGFFSYAAGVAYQVLRHWQVGGLEIDSYKMDLPIKKGLSSSAAVCVLVARAFNRLYDLRLTIHGEMDLAYRGEVTTPSRCGRMDQGCAYGSRPILMTFDQDIVGVEELRAGGPFHILIVDLNGKKDTVKILADLNQSYPFARSERDREVQEYLGPVNRRIVLRAVEALRAGDAERLGRLMTEAQELFDRHLAPSSPEELRAPLLHKLLSFPEIQPFIWGGKGVGSQGDGTAQLLCRGVEERKRASEIIENELGMNTLPLDILPAEKVTQCLIPAAGFGSELFPAAKVAQKELFPVIDTDGVAKPALFINVEAAASCGFERIVLVVRPEEKENLKRFFGEPLPPERFHRLPDHIQYYHNRVIQLGRNVKLVVQERPLGFGHAVYCGKGELGDQPFALFLGDYLYRSRREKSCLEQLVEVYEKTQKTVVGVKRIREDELGSYGVVAGSWIEPGSLLQVTEIAEKPSVRYAREALRVPGLSEGEYFGLFGLYVLGTSIFEHLDHVIENGLDVAGQYELTTALDRLRAHEECLGYVVEGESYDIGQPDRYLKALRAFRKPRDGEKKKRKKGRKKE